MLITKPEIGGLYKIKYEIYDNKIHKFVERYKLLLLIKVSKIDMMPMYSTYDFLDRNKFISMSELIILDYEKLS